MKFSLYSKKNQLDEMQELAQEEPERLQVIDALGSQQEVTAKVLQAISRVISGEK